MARYEVFLRRSVLKKDLARIPRTHVRRIMEVIGALANNPRPPGTMRLSGQERYRLRQGDYRIIFSIEDEAHTVWVVKVGHRCDVHR